MQGTFSIEAAASSKSCFFGTAYKFSLLLLLLGGIAESISDSAYCDRCIRAWSVCLSVCRLSHSCTLLKPLYGIRCHLAGTLGQVHCTRQGPLPNQKKRSEGKGVVQISHVGAPAPSLPFPPPHSPSPPFSSPSSPSLPPPLPSLPLSSPFPFPSP